MYLSQKRTVVIVLLLIFIAIFGGYLVAQKSLRDSTSESDRVQVRVGVANAGGEFSSLIIVAHAQGYFANEGLNVVLSKEESGVAAFKSLKEGSVDIITASDFAFVNNSFSDASAKIIATIDAADAVEVIVRRDTGISSPSDLAGKRIGIVPQTAAEFVLIRFLALNNLSINDVTIVNLTYGDAEEAIVNEMVDAVIINNPSAYNISKALGANGMSWPVQHGQRLLFNAISSDAFINSHPQAIESFLQALVKAEQFIKSSPDQAKQDVLESFSFTQDYLDKLWDNHEFVVRLDQALLPTLEAQARWALLIRGNSGTDIPNYFERVYIDGLEGVSPEAMTIIR